jgi:TM2 domain-containing membrane protein YozV
MNAYLVLINIAKNISMNRLIIILIITYISGINLSKAAKKNLASCGLKDSIQISISEVQLNRDTIHAINHPKRTAAILTLTLGMLGVHRLYLGCKPWVPVFYLLTVGGGFFILPVIDLIFILKSKNISEYYNNSDILMWLKK